VTSSFGTLFAIAAAYLSLTFSSALLSGARDRFGYHGQIRRRLFGNGQPEEGWHLGYLFVPRTLSTTSRVAFTTASGAPLISWGASTTTCFPRVESCARLACN